MTAVLGRIAAMQPGELGFRLHCELRKAAGLAGATLRRPRWDRARLAPRLRLEARSPGEEAARRALGRRDYVEAHHHLAAHFSTRRSCFPLEAAALPQRVAAILHTYPEAPAQAAARALRVHRGEYDLLGHENLALGSPPDWHADPVHQRSAPRVFWAAVPYLDPATGDHKVIWELNRHQHWLALGRAHALTGDARFYRDFTAQLASWLDANPPLIGTNWASMLELAFRALTWLWCLELFAAAGARDETPWLVDLLVALDRQLTHVEHNLSHYFSPNTHLTGEALALYVAGLALPELKASGRRAAIGRDVLAAQARRQIRADGGHAELSGHYHRYSTDFYLLAAAAARRAGDPAAPVFEDAARRQARFLRAVADDRGIRPQFGDDDGGQLFPICGRDAADCRDTLATAAVLLDEPALLVDGVPEETHWLCGERAAGIVDPGTSRWTSTPLPASGYFVSRTARGDHLVFDAGPHGYLNGGHAHADALSAVLSIAGTPLLIDPGTATYTMDPDLRDRFRSTPMHNTLVLDGRSQSEPLGAFHWKTRADAHASIWRAAAGCDYAEGTHAAYAPVQHTRAILAAHELGWWILDHVLGAGAPLVETYWHLDPAWRCSLTNDRVSRLERDGRALALGTTAGLSLLDPGEHSLAVCSRVYGRLERSPTLRGRLRAELPATIATFIPSSPDLAEELVIERARVERGPGEGWHACAFRVRWQGGAMALLAAVERGGIAAHESSAPPARWGTDALETDARVALLVDRIDGPSEAILVNGSCLHTPADALISLPGRTPLTRRITSVLAPTMHEVVPADH
jgi:hypothetical protein